MASLLFVVDTLLERVAHFQKAHARHSMNIELALVVSFLVSHIRVLDLIEVRKICRII